MDHKISAFNAKTHFSELLRGTDRGEFFTICRRGKPVARLTPPEKEPPANITATLASLDAIRKEIKGRLNVTKLIKAGRRY